MSKYDHLGKYLSQQNRNFIPMTFREIESIVGRALPASKNQRAWWSNNPTNNVMTRQWLEAGYETEAVDIASEKLIFRKKTKTANSAAVVSQPMSDADLPDHPIFGCMVGTLTVMPGVDLTEPMEFEWSGELYNE
jgi:hypothetical protein